MNLKEFIHSIVYSASSRARTNGEILFKDGLASNIRGKKIAGVYHLYGKVNDNHKDYNSHIKFDLAKGKVIGSSCTCEESYENSKLMKSYLCKHNIATAYMFYNLAKKRAPFEKNKAEKRELEEKLNKELIKLDIKVKQVKEGIHEFYEVEFRIGRSITYLISSIEKFMFNKESLIPYSVTQQFTYFPMRECFSKGDENLLKFISKYIKENKLKNIGKYKKIEGKSLRLLPQDIKSLLEVIENDKKIIFNYNYLEYSGQVINGDLPLSFTLKLLKDKLVLRTKVKFPIHLNEAHNAYLYDRNIYIPSSNQVKYYKDFYTQLKENGEIKFEKSVEVVSELINILNKITNDIMIDEGARRFIATVITPQFYFDKVGNNLLCKVKINYGGKIVDILKDTDKSFIRDYKVEEKIDRELERLSFIKKDDIFTFVGDDEEIFNLLSFGLENLSKFGNINLSKKFNEIRVISTSLINAEINEIDEEFYLNYNTNALSIRDLQSSLIALGNNKSFYKTEKNNFLDLKDPEIIALLNVVDLLEFNEDDKIKIDKNKAIFLNKGIQEKKLEFVRDMSGINKIKDKLFNRDNTTVVVPEDLNATLRGYQVIGFNWLNALSSLGFGGILADEMGLGKTIQVIAFLLSNKGSKSIIITPTSLIYNWKDEFEKFAPSINVGLIHGSTSKNHNVLKSMDEYDVILTTYGTLRNSIEVYKDKYFKVCIIDEAQNIKNSKAQITNVVKAINGECKIALTGTPMENNLTELWSIFDFIMPGFLFSENKFKEKFILRGDKGLYDLKSLINPFILRREKREVLSELPDKIEKKSLVEMTAYQKQLYKSYIKEVKIKLKKDKENRIAVFSYLTKLRQLCLDPSLLIDGYLGGSGKLKEAMRITKVAIESNKKILLFSQFTSALNKISNELSEENIDYLYLDGSTPAKERVKLVKKFNESEAIKIFLISLKAGGTGLNLTSANIVIHFDPWWNPAIEDQATDRAHRIGQKNVVEVIKLISKDTIEEKIVKIQEDKKELINKVMNGEDMGGRSISTLTNEEILDLFN